MRSQEGRDDYDPSYPIFVRNDDERLHWKLSLDLAIQIYGLELPRDVDLLQFTARNLYNSSVTTEQMLGPQPVDRPG